MKNITQVSEHERAIFYKAICDCMSDDDIITLELEADKKFGILLLHLWQDMFITNYYRYESWYGKLWCRLRAATRVLFTGRVDITGEFIFSGEGAIREFIIALEAGLCKLKKEKEND